MPHGRPARPRAIFSYKGSRPTFVQLAVAVRKIGLIVLALVPICTGAGIIIGVLANSGLGFTFTNSLFLLGAGGPILLLVLAAAVCVVLGTGLPTLGVYVLFAKLVVRGLVEIGITSIAAHLFVPNFGMTSMITPPVAAAAFTAAGIADADCGYLGKNRLACLRDSFCHCIFIWNDNARRLQTDCSYRGSNDRRDYPGVDCRDRLFPATTQPALTLTRMPGRDGALYPCEFLSPGWQRGAGCGSGRDIVFPR